MEIVVVVVEAGSLIAGGELVAVLEDYLPEGAPVHLLYARDRRATSKRTSLIDFVIERFGARAWRPMRGVRDARDACHSLMMFKAIGLVTSPFAAEDAR